MLADAGDAAKSVADDHHDFHSTYQGPRSEMHGLSLARCPSPGPKEPQRLVGFGVDVDAVVACNGAYRAGFRTYGSPREGSTAYERANQDVQQRMRESGCSGPTVQYWHPVRGRLPNGYTTAPRNDLHRVSSSLQTCRMHAGGHETSVERFRTKSLATL